MPSCQASRAGQADLARLCGQSELLAALAVNQVVRASFCLAAHTKDYILQHRQALLQAAMFCLESWKLASSSLRNGVLVQG